jgi:hypothetical protein
MVLVLKHAFAPAALAAILAWPSMACSATHGTQPREPTRENPGPREPISNDALTQEDLVMLTQKLLDHYGPEHASRVRRGIDQVSLRWRRSDGDAEALETFVRTHFITDPKRLTETLGRFDDNLEVLNGHRVALRRHLRAPVDLDQGKPLPVDSLFFAYDPFAHAGEDAFASKLAFVALLNFPLYTVAELDSTDLDREHWAASRLAASYRLRIPGEAQREASAAYAAAREYTSSYNIHMANVRVGERQPFSDGKALISHWGLRDELKALYGRGDKAVEDQRIIYTIMQRIIRQEIPRVVIDNPDVAWDPIANRLPNSPAQPPDREPDTRYAHLLDIFRVERAIDAFTPSHPTLMARRFDIHREMSEERVKEILISVLTDPVAKDTARLIARRLKRPMEPFDIWYSGFKGSSTRPGEAELSAQTRARYPNAAAFEADLPRIWAKLGFSPDQIALLTKHVAVDPSRGAGHAMRAGMRSDKARLRTRVAADGMDYKGYNIAMHELGHNVEQVFSLNLADYFVLSGVPNTAFTEAFAFLFQARDLEVLGLPPPMGAEAKTEKAASDLGMYWSTFEIAGVALLDMAVWRHMYENPGLDAGQLREAVVALAIGIWNDYYAPVFGVRDSPILAIYTHMIAYGLYLPDYPLGHVIEFQIESYLKGRSLAGEMERMCRLGRLTPEKWMKEAVGAGVSAEPMLEAAREAARVLGAPTAK